MINLRLIRFVERRPWLGNTLLALVLASLLIGAARLLFTR